jgi:hypothetical protein
MPEPDRDRAILRVHSFSGIPSSELRQLLADVEYAYNGVSGFDYFVRRFEGVTEFRRRFVPWPEAFPLVPGPLTFSREQVALHVPIDRSMYVHRVKLESPGFWDFLGRTLSLEALNEWLNGHHDRRERRARAPHRERMDDLDYEDRRTQVLYRRYRACQDMGLSEEDLAPLANELVAKPLRELDKHADSGLITGTEILQLPPSRHGEGDETNAP